MSIDNVPIETLSHVLIRQIASQIIAFSQSRNIKTIKELLECEQCEMFPKEQLQQQLAISQVKKSLLAQHSARKLRVQVQDVGEKKTSKKTESSQKKQLQQFSSSSSQNFEQKVVEKQVKTKTQISQSFEPQSETKIRNVAALEQQQSETKIRNAVAAQEQPHSFSFFHQNVTKLHPPTNNEDELKSAWQTLPHRLAYFIPVTESRLTFLRKCLQSAGFDCSNNNEWFIFESLIEFCPSLQNVLLEPFVTGIQDQIIPLQKRIQKKIACTKLENFLAADFALRYSREEDRVESWQRDFSFGPSIKMRCRPWTFQLVIGDDDIPTQYTRLTNDTDEKKNTIVKTIHSFTEVNNNNQFTLFDQLVSFCCTQENFTCKWFAHVQSLPLFRPCRTKYHLMELCYRVACLRVCGSPIHIQWHKLEQHDFEVSEHTFTLDDIDDKKKEEVSLLRFLIKCNPEPFLSLSVENFTMYFSNVLKNHEPTAKPLGKDDGCVWIREAPPSSSSSQTSYQLLLFPTVPSHHQDTNNNSDLLDKVYECVEPVQVAFGEMVRFISWLCSLEGCAVIEEVSRANNLVITQMHVYPDVFGEKTHEQKNKPGQPENKKAAFIYPTYALSVYELHKKETSPLILLDATKFEQLYHFAHCLLVVDESIRNVVVVSEQQVMNSFIDSLDMKKKHPHVLLMSPEDFIGSPLLFSVVIMHASGKHMISILKRRAQRKEKKLAVCEPKWYFIALSWNQSTKTNPDTHTYLRRVISSSYQAPVMWGARRDLEIETGTFLHRFFSLTNTFHNKDEEEVFLNMESISQQIKNQLKPLSGYYPACNYKAGQDIVVVMSFNSSSSSSSSDTSVVQMTIQEVCFHRDHYGRSVPELKAVIFENDGKKKQTKRVILLKENQFRFIFDDVEQAHMFIKYSTHSFFSPTIYDNRVEKKGPKNKKSTKNKTEKALKKKKTEKENESKDNSPKKRKRSVDSLPTEISLQLTEKGEIESSWTTSATSHVSTSSSTSLSTTSASTSLSTTSAESTALNTSVEMFSRTSSCHDLSNFMDQLLPDGEALQKQVVRIEKEDIDVLGLCSTPSPFFPVEVQRQLGKDDSYYSSSRRLFTTSSASAWDDLNFFGKKKQKKANLNQNKKKFIFFFKHVSSIFFFRNREQ